MMNDDMDAFDDSDSATTATGPAVAPGATAPDIRSLAASTPYLESSGGRYEPTPVAQGPWGHTIAGHVTGGLLAWALECHIGDPAWQPTRLTVDLMRPARMNGLEVHAGTVRDGRRIRLAEATLTQNGEPVARASAVFLRRGDQPDQQVWSMPVTMPTVPAGPVTMPRRWPFFLRAFGWGPDAPRADNKPGAQPPVVPKFAWVSEIRPLIDTQPLTGFTRAAMGADVANPLTHWGTAGMRFINVDFTLALSRLPEGPFIGLAAQTHTSHGGIASGVATLFDQHRHIGSCTVNAVSDGRFQSPFAT